MSIKPPVPVHRVVSAGVILNGDNGTRQKKLEAERIQIQNKKVIVGDRDLILSSIACWQPL